MPYLVRLVFTIRIINPVPSKKFNITNIGKEVKRVLRIFIIS
jgi:hypothetical protein